MRIGVRQGSSLVLVEEKCRSCSYKGGWHQWTGKAGEARTCGDTHGTTVLAHHHTAVT